MQARVEAKGGRRWAAATLGVLIAVLGASVALCHSWRIAQQHAATTAAHWRTLQALQALLHRPADEAHLRKTSAPEATAQAPAPQQAAPTVHQPASPGAVVTAGDSRTPRADSGLAHLVDVWCAGRLRWRYRYHGPWHRLLSEVRPALQRFRQAQPGAAGLAPCQVQISSPYATGPMGLGLPWLDIFAPVPGVEGVVATLGERRAWLTPAELSAMGAYESAWATPIPDLRVGTDLEPVLATLAQRLGTDLRTLRQQGHIRRFRAHRRSLARYPRAHAVKRATLRRAARDAGAFLLRHQQPDGRFVYLYHGGQDREVPAPYSIARHAGSAYFLAQLAHLARWPAARAGCRRALGWIEHHALRRCGSPAALCIDSGGIGSVGATALTAMAAAEWLHSGDDAGVRSLLHGLVTFILTMQRPDGELMHDFDLLQRQARDVQHLYFSGEAAVALLLAHRVLSEPRILPAVRRLMRHLTGKGWRFFGSHYYFGEEHWTCQAAALAARHMRVGQARDFCLRWAAFSRAVQYQPGETPWAASGAYGVGPLLPPRLTPVASRTEAFISVWQLAKAARHPDTSALQAQVQAGLGMLLRWQWRPGPVHQLANPAAAHGAIPGSPTSLEVRNDFVQHAGSAMLRWAWRAP